MTSSLLIYIMTIGSLEKERGSVRSADVAENSASRERVYAGQRTGLRKADGLPAERGAGSTSRKRAGRSWRPTLPHSGG